jgi:DNA-binding IclR family transcriptional regulator
MNYASGFWVWSCSEDSPEVIELAKQWIKDNGYSYDTVKIIRHGRCISVVVR